MLMIKIVETVKHKDGTESSSEKQYSNRKAFDKASQRLPGIIRYDLMKTGKHVIEYDDATVTITLIDTEKTAKILGLDGKPIVAMDGEATHGRVIT